MQFTTLPLSAFFREIDRLTTHADGSSRGRFLPVFVCLSACFSAQYLENRCSQDHQTWQIKCSTTSSGNSLIFWIERSKVKATRHKKQCRHGFLHSCECWPLLVYKCSSRYCCCDNFNVLTRGRTNHLCAKRSNESQNNSIWRASYQIYIDKWKLSMKT